MYRSPNSPPVEPKPALVCPCHYSTFDPATGGTVLFGPAGRRLPMLPLAIDGKGSCAPAGNFNGAVGPSWWGVRNGKPIVIRKAVRFLDERTGTAPFLRKTLRYLFPDHWSFLLGEVALYAFIVLVATGIYLTFFFVDSTHEVVYHGSYAPLLGQQMCEAYRSVVDISPDVRPAC